jgi:rubredoxin
MVYFSKGRAEARRESRNKERIRSMKKYVCPVCGYEYDPAKGDPSQGIQPGTPFEALPENWTCPTCGVAKDQFTPAE